MPTPKIYIGAHGWKYDGWLNCFYPMLEIEKYDWLRFYSQYFNIVKIETVFANRPDIAIDHYLEAVSENNDFLFIYKLPMAFTHTRKFRLVHVNSMHANLHKLKSAERLGGVLIQFPYTFEFTDENAAYVAKIVDMFSEYKPILEVRHNSWRNEAVINYLTETKIPLCSIDMPVIENFLEFNPVTTSDTLYIHLYGRNKEAWLHDFNKKYIPITGRKYPHRNHYFYSPGELLEIERGIDPLRDKVERIFILLYNHIDGYAIANAFELISMLNGRIKIQIPQTAIQTFSRLSKLSLHH
jgi:uncharacterized protein YecE (DUF72 family)